MFRLLSNPINEKSLIAGQDLESGELVYEAANGTALKSSTAANDVKSVWIAVRNTEIQPEAYQNEATIKSGISVRVVNGCSFLCDADTLKIADSFGTVSTRGDFLGIKSGKICIVSSATASTTDYFRFESFVGDTDSGIMKATMKAMI